MDKQKYDAEVAALSPAAQQVINSLDGVSATKRISTALFIIMASQRATRTLTDDQLFDLFDAGMHAHRLASAESFVNAVFFEGEGMARLEKAGGVSASALARMAILQIEESKKAAERFINLTHMLEPSK